MKRFSDEDRAVFQEESHRWWNLANERLKISVEYAQAGIRALFLSNGGAIIALLTFAGNGGSVEEPIALFWSFIWFGAGVTASLGTYITAYLSQSQIMQVEFGQYTRNMMRRLEIDADYDTSRFELIGTRAERLGLGLAVSALLFFIVGAFVGLDAIT